MEPQPPKTPFSVAIIGGGLGGLTLAVGLQARGVSATIYEANDALRETGLGLSIGPAAHRALPLIDAELGKLYDSMVTTHADSPGLEHMRETWFQAIRAHGDRGGEVFTTLQAKPSGLTSVGRSEYLGALIKLLPKDRIKLAKTLTSLEVHDSGVTLHFGDSTTETADIVIGCDGIKSKVKECLFSEAGEKYKPSFSGMYVYRGIVDMNVLEQAMGSQARIATWHLAPRRYIIHYPISKATKVNMGCYIECPEWKSESWVQPAGQEDLLRDFGDMTGPVQGLLKIWPSFSQWAIFEDPPLHTFIHESVALMGDAAHAASPHQGAGAGQAIEDAYVLAELLADPRVIDASSARAALVAYDKVRRPRSQDVVRTSRENAKALCLTAPGIGADETKLSKLWKTRFHWLWDIDIKAHAQSALDML